MVGDFKIRRATIDDVPLVFQFIKELAIYEKRFEDVTVTEVLLKNNLFVEHKYAEVLLGFYEEQVVAFAIYFYHFSTFSGKSILYLEDLFVKQQLRGRGLGKKLLKYLAAIAKNEQCERMMWSVLDWNELAINFYNHIGATQKNDSLIFYLDKSLIDKLAT